MNSGPFAACLSSIPAQGHMDSCVYDVCSTKGTKTTMKQLSCAAMATMAEECTALRFVINQWRTLSGCSKLIFFKKGTFFNYYFHLECNHSYWHKWLFFVFLFVFLSWSLNSYIYLN